MTHPATDYSYKGLLVQFVDYENDLQCVATAMVSLPDGRLWFRETFYPIDPRSLSQLVNREIDLKIALAESVLELVRSQTSSPYR